MPTNPMPGPFPLAGVAMPTWMLRFDDDGTCTSPESRARLLSTLAATSPTDVLFMSHGWNNDFDAATTLYREFLVQLEAQVAAHPPGRPFRPVFVGIAWPSQWLTFDDGPAIAGAGDTDLVATTRASLLARVRAVSPDDAERAAALLARPTLRADESAALAQLLLPAFADATDDELDDGPRALTADDLRAAADAEAAALAPPPSLDEWGGTGSAGAAAGAPQAAGLLRALDPRTYLRLFSVYQMKDRAGRVGTRGIAPLLRDLLSHTDARVHAAGHSYGCRVVLSAVCAPAPMARPLASVLLLQPALSHLAMAARVPGTSRAGGYRRALDPARVTPPILTTYSRKDLPLHKTFHLSLRRAADLGELQIASAATAAGDPPSRYAAMGGYGPRGAGQRLQALPHAGVPYALQATTIIGLDGSANLINDHGDVRTPHTAWAMYELLFGTR